MVPRVKPTPNRFPTNSRYIPMGNTPLHFIPSVCCRALENALVVAVEASTPKAYPRVVLASASTLVVVVIVVEAQHLDLT